MKHDLGKTSPLLGLLSLLFYSRPVNNGTHLVIVNVNVFVKRCSLNSLKISDYIHEIHMMIDLIFKIY